MTARPVAERSRARNGPFRLAIVATHPVQYFAPLYRALAERSDLTVFFAHRATPQQQAAAGFGTAFEWDVDLTAGFRHVFLDNIAQTPDATTFKGCDTPRIGAHLAEGAFDAVMTTGWYTRTHLQTVLACRRQRRPVLVRSDSQLGYQPSRLKRAVKRFAYPVLLRAFDGVITVGTRSRAFLTHHAYPPARIFHAPHAIDTARFAAGAASEAGRAVRAAAGLADDQRVVLFAGKLLPFKRPLDVVEAVSRLDPDGRTAVLVAGSGPLEAAMRARAEALGVPLHILGFVNQSRMPAAYAAADVLVLPSTGRETWGLVTNEALASGTPVIVSDAAGAAPDIAADGHVGRTFRGGDIADLAATLGAVFAAPPSAAEITAVSDRFSLARAAEGILAAARACAHVPEPREMAGDVAGLPLPAAQRAM